MVVAVVVAVAAAVAAVLAAARILPGPKLGTQGERE